MLITEGKTISCVPFDDEENVRKAFDRIDENDQCRKDLPVLTKNRSNRFFSSIAHNLCTHKKVNYRLSRSQKTKTGNDILFLSSYIIDKTPNRSLIEHS